MKQNRHDDEKLINLLREFPSIEDHRSMNEIYSSVKEETGKVRQQKHKRLFIWPSIAITIVLLLSVFLVSDKFDPIVEKDRITNHSEIAYEGSLERNESEEQGEYFSILKDDGENEENYHDRTENVSLNAIYAKDMEDEELVVTIGIPDKQAMNIVPVSVIVNDSHNKHWIDHYNEIFQQIDEEKLGLTDYYPYNGILKTEDNHVILDLDENHNYDMGSASELIFLGTLQFFKYQNIDKIYLQEETKPGVYLSHTGEKIYEYVLDDYEKSGFLLYHIGNKVFYVPSPNESTTVHEALEDMKRKNEMYQLEPSIPDHLADIETNEDSGELFVTFQGKPELTNDLQTLRMIEAILLTAKEYGFQEVQFMNTNLDQIGPFNIENPMEVPVAPNPVELKM